MLTVGIVGVMKLKTIKFTIPGFPKSDRDSLRVIKNGNYYKIQPSVAYTKYEKNAKFFISDMQFKISTPVCVKVNYYTDTNKKTNLADLLCGTCKLLKKYNIVDDCNSDIIKSHDGSSVSYDVKNPRAEVEIIPLEDI